MGNKRRRVALSCVDCRRRKVKCDRTYPACVRCEKGGYGDKCTYVTHTSDITQSSLPTPEDEQIHRQAQRQNSWTEEAAQWQAVSQNAVSAVRQSTSRQSAATPGSLLPSTSAQAQQQVYQLKGWLKDLEALVYSHGGRTSSQEVYFGNRRAQGSIHDRPGTFTADRYAPAESDQALLRGRSFKTQYFGPSHSLSILLQFEELSRFVRDILIAMPSLTNAKHSLARVRDMSKKQEKATYNLATENLIGMVPERPLTDRLVNLYLEVIETTYRVLHVATFQRDYEAFWQSPKDAAPEFIVQLLLMSSITYCVLPLGPEGYLGRSSVRRETATHWVNVCQHWLDMHSKKHVDLAFYQIHLLLWFARRMNCIKVKREWTSIGSVLRLFMSAGLHREPSVMSKRINVFDCEMRRRLWYTVLELELQASVDRGIVPSLSHDDWDTLPPRNIDDESFGPDSEGLPESNPREIFTRTSFLVLQSESMPLRLEAVHKINRIRDSLELDTIMYYDDKFRTLLDELPVDGWKSHDRPTGPLTTTASHAATTPISPRPFNSASTQIASTLSKLVVFELILVLHQPIATIMPPIHRHFFSRAALRDASLICVTIYTRVLNDIHRHFFSSLRDDVRRAMLSIAHDLTCANAPALPSSNNVNNPSDNNAYTGSRENRHAIDLLQAAVNMLGERVEFLGQGFHGYWITSSALSFVLSKQSPQVPVTTFVRAAVDRVVKLHDKVLAEQLPQARQLIGPNDTYDGYDTNSPAAANLAGTNASATRSTRRSAALAATEDSLGNLGEPFAQTERLAAPAQTANGLDANLAQGMDLVGFDQADPFDVGLFDNMDGADWSAVWSIDPFSAMGAMEGGGGNLNNGDVM